MNLLGKIFTVLILLMSVCFFTIAVMLGASHQNWKDQALKLKGLIEQERQATELALSQSKKNAEQAENLAVAKTYQIAYLESRRQGLETDIKERETELAGLLESNRKIQENLRESERRLATQDTTVADLRRENKDKSNKIAGLVNRNVELTNAIYDLDIKIQNMKILEEQLAAQLAVYKRAIVANQINPYESLAGIQPDVAGVVNEVNGQFMTFTIGKDDGIIRGKEVFVTRDGKYMGKATITVVKDNEAGALIVPESVQSPIEKGDNVNTKLSDG